jgi:hypothetical protein
VVTALFEPVEDGRWLPTDRARGPWSPDALHGGPTAALLTRAVESAPADGPMQLARITVELLRPVSVAPLAVRVDVLRPGRKVQLVGASVFAGEVEVARAVALRIRAAAVEVDEHAGRIDPEPAPPMPEAQQRPKTDEEWEAFHNEGVELRFVGGFFRERGPATVWIRLRQPVVPGEEPSPAQRVAAVADFGNGVSSEVPWEEYLFINPDLTIHLARPPVGEWVCLDARTFLNPGGGVGLAESALYDERGRIGRSVQSLLLERRGSPRVRE